ncbi:conserved hypothetical protein [Alteracholeplasma palmae J233]|uniref:ATPase dynein-related AAA domain-containing protein n=1 Tax=Alteracholeplasma palmae (strain ATCC 49389 / J233) TaxID=1318466 RepID=U4KKJ7_ALTPJ|nr:hypothetical protein [Alteracholeplasma palmae]CCV64118.1 conserved hypothetical protein [Alteracholeplasma palmae J233]
MQEFSRWYIEILQKIGEGFIDFFKGIYQFFVNVFIKTPSDAFKSFVDASSNFTIVSWITAFIVLIINIIFIVAFFYLLFQYLKKYIRFTKKEIDKDLLLNEINELNKTLINVTNEKNAILAIKTDLAPHKGIQSTLISYSNEDEKKDHTEDSRFVKLIEVDETYQYKIMQTNMHEDDMINLNELVKRFINFSASQLNLYYTEKTVSIFIAGMATSKTMILEGISGTGKTSLPYAFGKFFNNDASLISVQPSWRDRTELLGYLNEFTKKFNETDFLKSIYEASYRTDINFIILDEMNLARVEYYFADFLSVLELPAKEKWLIDVTADQNSKDPIHLKGGKLLLPQNIWFVGTANKDDSTFTITDKVYDRAASIEMNDKAKFIDAKPTANIHMSYEYLNELFTKAQKDYPIEMKTLENLNLLDEYISSKFKITFGNRIMKQIKEFIPVYVACGKDEIDGLDYLVSRKIIRKFETLNLAFLQKDLENLIKYLDKLFGKDNFLTTKQMIKEYIREN